MASRTITTALLLVSTNVFAETSEEIVVEASKSPTERAWRSAASVTVLSIDDSLPMSTTVGTLIDRAPGVTLQTFGDPDSFAGVSIRGSTMRQVSVYLDGIPLNPEGGQAVSLSEWPLRAFKRIEVYRGNAPSSLGGAAIGGAINLVRDDDFEGTASAGAVTNHGRFSIDGHTTVSPQIRGHEHRVSAYLNAIVNRGRFTYYSDNGTPYNRIDDERPVRDHNRSSTFHALLGWQTQVGAGQLNVLDTWMGKGAELPGHVNNPASGARLDTKRNLLGVRYEPGIDGHNAHLVGWWLARTEKYSDPLDELGLGAQELYQDTSSVGLRLHDTFTLTKSVAVRGTIGFARDSSSTSDAGTESTSARQGRTAETITADIPITIGQFSVSPVLHGTFIQQDNGPTSTSIDPRIGLRHAIADWAILRANGGSYIRPPDATELSGDRGSMVGNPDLKPEQGWQWDVGARARLLNHENTRWSLDLGHFWNAGKDRITWVQNSQRTMIPVNLGKTWIQGLEAAVHGQVADLVFSETNVTWVNSRNLSPASGVANNDLPSVAPVNVWHTTALVFLEDKIRLSHTIRHVSASFLDETNWIRTPPRTAQDLAVQGHPGERWPIIELSVTNLTNKIAEAVPSNPLDSRSGQVLQPVTDFAGYPLPGRTFMLSLRWHPGAAL